MSAKRTDLWLEDFTLSLTDECIEREAQDPGRYETFTGSRGLAAAWVSALGVIGGAFGGLLVSAWLWSSLLRPLVWLGVLVAACLVLRGITVALLGIPIRFLAGWCFFWGFLIGLCAVWAAQLDSPYWAYGIAGGFGFLLGITHGVYEHPDMRQYGAWFGLGVLLAPLSVVAAAWGSRNLIDGPAMASAAATGASAALIFLAPLMAMLAANWRNEDSLRRLAALFLHSDRYAAKALPLIDRALKLKPSDPGLYNLRGIADALLGDMAGAEADWRRHLELQPNSVEPLIARGAFLIRRGRLDEAIAVLDEAAKAAPKHARAIAALGFAHHRRGDLDRAVACYERAVKLAPEPLALTRLAAARCDTGDYRSALRDSDDAIGELDSIHGLSWLVRARAHLALGHLHEAEDDFRLAYQNGGEDGVAEEARAGLERMGLRPE